MISGFTILGVEGSVESSDSLLKQRFPRLNVNLEKVEQSGDKVNVWYSFDADYHDGDAKDAKKVGHIKLKGKVEVTDSKDQIASIMKKWNDSHMLPVSLAEEIINGLNFRCGATGTLVAYSLGLIPPLIVSTTKIQEQKEQK